MTDKALVVKEETALVDPWANVELEKVGLRVDGLIPFEQWQAVGERLRFMHGAVLWWTGDWMNYGEDAYGEQYAQALEPKDHSMGHYINAGWVSRRVDVSRRRETLSFKHHYEVATLEPDDQDDLLTKAEASGWSTRELHEEVQRFKKGKKFSDPGPLTGKYRVIYADPPWSYGNTMPDYVPDPGVHYPKMTLAELCELPVAGIAEDDAVLFLWATSPILEECFQVVHAWGFAYKSSFVWDKVKHNIGHYNSVRHEFLLICVRGSCQPDIHKLFDSVQTIERGEHSEKPEEFRQIIDTIYPLGRRIELFPRKAIDGWDNYGNEIPGLPGSELVSDWT